MQATVTLYPPQTILDEHGEQSGVILSLPDYQQYLKLLSQYADWETLPDYLQDAIDNLLVDEAEQESGELITLDALLAEEPQ